MKTIIIVPTYNESGNIERLIKEIFSLKIENLEIIIVDDNSPDGTSSIVESLKNNFPIHLIKRQGKLGLGSAYITGFKKALEFEADCVFEMDADFSHDPNDIPRLLEKMSNFDLSIGSRKIKGGGVLGWNWRRKMMSNGAMWFSRTLLGFKVKDVTAGFRCFRSQVLKTIGLDQIKSNGYAFQEELLYKVQNAGFKIVEVPVIFEDRKHGKSKLGYKDILEFFIVIFKLKLKYLSIVKFWKG